MRSLESRHVDLASSAGAWETWGYKKHQDGVFSLHSKVDTIGKIRCIFKDGSSAT